MDEETKARVEKLYYETYEFLFWYALSCLRNRPLAEEAVQSTFLIACSKPQSLLGSLNPCGWLTSTLKNVLRNRSASRVRQLRMLQRFLAEVEESPRSAAENSPELLLYESLSNVLSREEIDLLRKAVFDRCTLLEVAEEQNISVHACSKRLQRAKKKVQKFAEKWNEPVRNAGFGDINTYTEFI